MYPLLPCSRRNTKISSNRIFIICDIFWLHITSSENQNSTWAGFEQSLEQTVFFLDFSRKYGGSWRSNEAMERVFKGKESRPHRNPSDLLWLICAAMIRGWSVGSVRSAPALSWAPGVYRWLRPTTRDFRTGNSPTECTNQRIGSRLHQGHITLIYYSSVYRRLGSRVGWTFVSGPFLNYLRPINCNLGFNKVHQ